METRDANLLARWKRNFGNGAYAMVMLIIVFIPFQLAAYLYGFLLASAFPSLEDPFANPIIAIMSIGIVILLGVPLFGFLFRHFFDCKDVRSGVKMP